MPDLSTQTSLATFIVDPPDPFDFQHPEEWKNWLVRYNRYCNISGFEQLDQTRQIDTLIYTMGQEAERVFKVLNLKEKDRKSYNIVFQKIKRHFEIPTVNVISERIKFNQRVQQIEESVDSFVKDVYKLAEKCGFGALTEEHVRDRILAGMLDTELCKTLQSDPDLTLDKVRAKITNLEATEQEIESNSANSSPLNSPSPSHDSTDESWQDSSPTSSESLDEDEETTSAREKKLSNKIKKRKAKGKLVCSFCNKEFSCKTHLEIHIRSHTNERPFLCTDCGMKFKRKSHLELHMTRKHTDNAQKSAAEQKFSCDTCLKGFTAKATLNRHTKKIHLGIVDQKLTCCHICGVFQTNMKMHMITHTGEKPFSCDMCGKTFRKPIDLKEHQSAVHSGDKPYCCQVCGKTFGYINNLRSHEKKHSGLMPVKKYDCEYCEKQFSSKERMEDHRRAVHTGETPFSCEMCGNSYTKKRNLQTHRKTHMKEES